jgi:hypothetical protein
MQHGRRTLLITISIPNPFTVEELPKAKLPKNPVLRTARLKQLQNHRNHLLADHSVLEILPRITSNLEPTFLVLPRRIRMSQSETVNSSKLLDRNRRTEDRDIAVPTANVVAVRPNSIEADRELRLWYIGT